MALDLQRTGASKPVRDLKRFWKTELCRFYPKCIKGEACPFAHAQVEMQTRPDLTKTTFCRAWQRKECPLPSDQCKFAHGPEDLRATKGFAAPAAPKNGIKARHQRTRSKASGEHDVNGDVASEHDGSSDSVDQLPSDTVSDSGLGSISNWSSLESDDHESFAPGRLSFVRDVGSFTPGGRGRRVPVRGNNRTGRKTPGFTSWGDIPFGNLHEGQGLAMAPVNTVQVPMVIDMRTGQVVGVGAHACFMQSPPQALSPTQQPGAAMAEAVLRAAMPEYYED
jgi:hypothetical protein